MKMLRATRTVEGWAVSGLRLRKDGYIVGWYYLHGERYRGIWTQWGMAADYKWLFASRSVYGEDMDLAAPR